MHYWTPGREQKTRGSIRIKKPGFRMAQAATLAPPQASSQSSWFRPALAFADSAQEPVEHVTFGTAIRQFCLTDLRGETTGHLHATNAIPHPPPAHPLRRPATAEAASAQVCSKKLAAHRVA